MSGGMISNKPVLKRLGTPADTDVSTDILNLDGKADTISTAVVTDIPATITTLDGKADTISTAVVTDIPATITTLDGKADTISTAVVTDIPATITTLDGKADTISTAVVTDIPATITTLDGKADTLLENTVETATMWFVDASVSSSGTGGSWTEAFKTITEAETARSAGDYVLIKAGTYDENTVAGGLVIAKDNGTFIVLGGSDEAIIVNNSHVSATDVITVSGDYNYFMGVKSVQAGINAWNITGTDNKFKNCSGSNSGVGFILSSASVNNNFLNCRSETCTTSIENDGTGNIFKDCNILSSTTGIKVTDDADKTIIKNCFVGNCTTGYQFDASSTLSYLDSCSGDNTTNITDNSAGGLTVIDFNTESQITAGNSIQQDVDAVYDRVETTPKIVSRTAATVPDTTATPYFTVSGRVLITQIVGEVTTVMNATATDIKLISNPTVGDDVDLCVAVAVAEDAVGTLYTITGTLSDAMIATTSGAVKSQANSILVTAGTIDLDSSATQTGATKWTVHYIPLDSGSTVVTA